MRPYIIILLAATLFTGCDKALQRPDFGAPREARDAPELKYDVTLINIDPSTLKQANRSPFVLYANVSAAGQDKVRRIPERELFEGPKPAANKKPKYKIGIADQIQIIGTGEFGGSGSVSGLNRPQPVDESGKIKLTNGTSVKIAGLTIEQASEAVEKAIANIGRRSARTANLGTFPTQAPEPYEIGSGDVIAVTQSVISTNDNGEITTGIEMFRSLVGPDGVVSILSLGDIDVGGLTLPQVRDRVFQEAVRAGTQLEFVVSIEKYESQSAVIIGILGTHSVPISDLPQTYGQVLAKMAPNIDGFNDFWVKLKRGDKYYGMSARDLITGKYGTDHYVLDGDIVEIFHDFPDGGLIVSVREFISRKISYLRVTFAQSSQQPAQSIPLNITGLDLRQLLVSQHVDVNRNKDLLVRLNRGSASYRLSAQSIILKDPNTRYWLEPEDHVIVEDISYVGDNALLVGELNRPQRLPIDRHTRTTLSQALFEGDVFQDNEADFNHIYVFRGDGLTYDAYHFDATQVLKLSLAEEFELRPGDIVFIRSNPIIRYNRTLAPALAALGLTRQLFQR